MSLGILAMEHTAVPSSDGEVSRLLWCARDPVLAAMGQTGFEFLPQGFWTTEKYVINNCRVVNGFADCVIAKREGDIAFIRPNNRRLC